MKCSQDRDWTVHKANRNSQVRANSSENIKQTNKNYEKKAITMRLYRSRPRQQPIPVAYDDLHFDEGFRADLAS